MKKYALLLIMLLGFSGLVHSQPAAEPDPAFLNYALQEASNLTNIPITTPPPTVVFMHDHKKFVLISCRVTKVNCTAFAAYVFAEHTIYIDATQVNVYTIDGFAILVHEMVHHLQVGVLYNKNTCAAVERQAYTAQDKFLRKHKKQLYNIESDVHESCKEAT